MASHLGLFTYLGFHTYNIWLGSSQFMLTNHQTVVLVPMGVNHGGNESPGICSGGTPIQVLPPDFCHFSKFQALTMDSSPQISTQIYATACARPGKQVTDE
jgi:hypothetical protein